MNEQRFNAPIPEYADLNFLFYRWGYGQLGDKGLSMFCKNIEQHCFEGMLRFYLQTENPIALISETSESDSTEQEREEITSAFFSTGATKEQLEKSGVELHDLDGDIAEIVSMSVQPERGEVYVLNYEGNYAWETLMKGENLSDPRARFQTTNGKGFAEAIHSFDEIFVERKNLMAFEQKSGSFNHGLSDNYIEEHAPDLTKEQKSQRKYNPINNLKGHVTLLTIEQNESTIQAYEDAKRRHPHDRSKTVRLQTAAEIISERQKKKIGGKAIERRLKKLGYSDW